MTVKYLDLEGQPALMDERQDGRVLAWVHDDQDWQKVHVTEIAFSAREIGEKKFKERFPDAGLPEGVGK